LLGFAGFQLYLHYCNGNIDASDIKRRGAYTAASTIGDDDDDFEVETDFDQSDFIASSPKILMMNMDKNRNKPAASSPAAMEEARREGGNLLLPLSNTNSSNTNTNSSNTNTNTNSTNSSSNSKQLTVKKVEHAPTKPRERERDRPVKLK